ncbi:MAG: redox-regulated ATPase YchF [Firmicutes bacterium]|nr:redox-regulated ATPase YchF [Bacillota bacterium]
MDIGIIGLSGVGKTSFFNLLTGGKADAGYGGGRGQANMGMGRVPDPRIDRLSAVFQPKKTTYATIRFIDVAGLQPSTQGERRTGDFLNDIRNVDCLVHVVRGFASDVVPHVAGSIDPLRDLELIHNELLLTDWGFVETRLEKLAKERVKNPNLAKEEPILRRCMEALEEGRPLSTVDLSEDEEKLMAGYTFFTRKPMIIVVNLDEDQLQSGEYPNQSQVQEWCRDHALPLIEVSAQVELEISQLDEADRDLFMEEYGLKETGIARLARTAYSHLGLISFFTVGQDEVRAWTVRDGATAQEAGGKIHSDIARGFIRAEVCSYADFIEHGSMAALKEKGLLRLEGKDYKVKDADIMTFRFNV